MRTIRISALSAALLFFTAAHAGKGEGDRSSMHVEVSKGSAFMTLQLENHRKIGKVVILIRDVKGNLVYREEGKAMQEELVRRLDRRALPAGTLTVEVESRDMHITQVVENR